MSEEEQSGGVGGPQQLEEWIFQLWFGILVQMEKKTGKFCFKKRNRTGLEECGSD